MKNTDLTVKDTENMLNIRVAGIIIKDNRVLMVKNLRSDYIYSLGGQAEIRRKCTAGRSARSL